ncbi:hypothetical protein SAMN05216266_101354 [Amycolatopsis marina]|uniref:Uncharacterized protein n=1 Tax=Amycolatopsis marina TaxID=490629 RepID=A0A1I0VNH6_9PSEU|nr:hypothetical protein [Amycolatopsis marina]SFA77543.1 hypothetical protein SAMN05216266_101354 [Amycolatopsis marina]
MADRRSAVSKVGAVGAILALAVTMGSAPASAAPVPGLNAAVIGDHGYVTFAHKGEILSAYAEENGIWVKAQLFWDGKIRASVTDSNGPADGGSSVDLSIAESTEVKLRVCEEGKKCSNWRLALA